ncbi:MAG: efflux RND transporter periplasmic adaptor subunit [Bacteroidetes bacterium]|nr:efflux RND transporter periplasmic adaptor subunit [Bacteroidota bacterium]
MKKNRILYILIGVVVILVIIMIANKKDNATKVSVEKVTYRTIVETVSASGKIYPEVEVKISSDVSGEIIELSIEEGDSVIKGDLLAKINPDIYNSVVERAEAALNSTRANLANAKARFSQAEARFMNAELTFKRNKDLYEDKVISTVDFETAETTFKTSRAELEAAKQTVVGAEFSIKSSEATVKEARDNLLKTTIYAPISGTISRLNVEVGERVVGTVQMIGTEMMRVANLNDMEVHVDVSENDILKVALADTVDIEVDAYLGKEFRGLVTEISNSAISGDQLNTDQITNFTVKIKLLRSSYIEILEKNPHNFPFRPGMSATVEIRTEIVKMVQSVPVKSVTTRKDDEQDSIPNGRLKIRELVFIYNDSGAVRQVEVQTGIQDDTYIEILSGLDTGIQVITGPFSAISKKLEDKMNVQVVEEKDLFEAEED